jgi:hypothetical protein
VNASAVTASEVTVTLRKPDTTGSRDLLFVGEIEIRGLPHPE